MNTKTVFNRLQSIDDEVQKLHNTIFALKTTDIQAYTEPFWLTLYISNFYFFIST